MRLGLPSEFVLFSFYEPSSGNAEVIEISTDAGMVTLPLTQELQRGDVAVPDHLKRRR